MRKVQISFLSFVALVVVFCAPVWAQEKNLFYHYPCGPESPGVVVENTTYNDVTGNASAWVGSPTPKGNGALVKGEYFSNPTIGNRRIAERIARERATDKALHFYSIFFCK